MKNAKKVKKNPIWEEGSDNVFADLNMPDAEKKLAKAKLASRINEIIAKEGLNQVQAAKLLEIDQSKISLLACGHLADFSVERLAHFLTLLNQDVDIVIRRSRKHTNHGSLRVVHA